MMKTIRKLKNNRGFTLSETLITVLIMLMVSTIMATGIPVAKGAYERVVLASNAEILLSTTISTLRNELGIARDIVISGTAGTQTQQGDDRSGTAVTYYNGQINAISRIRVPDASSQNGTPSDQIQYLRYAGSSNSEISDMQTGGEVPLISGTASTTGMYVTYKELVYNEKTGIMTFKNLEVRQSGTKGKDGNNETDKVLANRPELMVRVVLY